MPLGASSRAVLRLSVNRVGRDFVLGDICGDFEGVFEAMQEAEFDLARDRVFSVGHLIGGCGSTSAFLRFLRHPAVYAVRSDDEQDVVDLYEEGDPDENCVLALGAAFPGLAWISAADPAARKQVIDAIRRLPHAISVGEVEAAYGFVHAGVSAGLSWEAFMVALDQSDEPVSQEALRGRQSEEGGAVAGVGRVFVCFSPESEFATVEENVGVVLPGAQLLLIRALARVPVAAQ